MTTRRQFCSSALGIAAMGIGFSAVAQEEKRVITYNTAITWADWGAVLKKFTERTGIAAPPDNRTSGESLTSLLADKDHPLADFVYFGGDYACRAKDAGVIAPYKSKYWSDVPDALRDPEGFWTGVHTGTVGFFVNKAAFGKRPTPKSWADLLKPEYEGVVGYYDVALTAAGYVTALAVNLGLGGTLQNFDRAVDYFKRLQKNNPIIPRNAAYSRVVSGEIPLLIDFDFNAYRALYSDKVQAEVVIPKEGTISFPYTVTIVKGAPRQTNAKALVDFVLSDEGQQMWTNAYLRPARPTKMDPAVAARFLPASEYERAKTINIADAYAAKDQFAKFIERYKKEVV